MRAFDGRVHGLSDRWTHGVAQLGEGRMDFAAYVPLGIRVRASRRQHVELQVTSVSEASSPVASSAFGVGPALVGLNLFTAYGAVEVAVLREQATWVVDRLRPSGNASV